jgi:dsDNA-binding SOS-regulon protein
MTNLQYIFDECNRLKTLLLSGHVPIKERQAETLSIFFDGIINALEAVKRHNKPKLTLVKRATSQQNSCKAR